MRGCSARSRSRHTNTRWPIPWLAILLAALVIVPPNLLLIAQSDREETTGRANAEIASGMELFRSRDVVAAKLKFSAAVKADPHSADALTWRGIAENQLKQYAEAIRDFRAALNINPEEMSAHYNLALSMIRVGKTDDAIQQLLIVVKSNPGVVEPEYNLAVLLEQRKSTIEAVDHLQAAYRAQPNDIGVEQHLIVDLLLLGRSAEAEPILAALATGSSDQAKHQVGTALLEAGQFSSAARLLEAERTRTSANHDLDLLLARAYIGAGSYARAVALLSTGNSNDLTGESSYLLGLAYSGAGDLAEAKSAFERAVQRNARNSPALYHLGLLQSAEGTSQAEGLRHLREAIQLEPDNAAYAITLGRILLEQDRPAEALVVLQHIRPEGPASGERNLLLAIATISTSGSKKAISMLERSVSESPTLSLSYNILGFCYFQEGDYAKAAEAYKRASNLSPNSAIFAHDAATAFERSGNADQAKIYADRAVSLPTANGDDHYLVAKLLAQSGHKEEAIVELKKSVALSPDLDESYYLLARTYMQLGDTARASEWNAKLTDLKREHAQAYTAGKGAKPMASSTLLLGAAMPAEEKGEQ